MPLALHSDQGSDMSAILIRAKIVTEIETLSTREQWPDSAISQLAILLATFFIPFRILG